MLKFEDEGCSVAFDPGPHVWIGRHLAGMELSTRAIRFAGMFPRLPRGASIPGVVMEGYRSVLGELQ